MDLSALQSMRTALMMARFGGELEVSYKGPNGERTVKFKSDAEMAKALAALDAEIAKLTGGNNVASRSIQIRQGYY